LSMNPDRETLKVWSIYAKGAERQGIHGKGEYWGTVSKRIATVRCLAILFNMLVLFPRANE